MVRNKKQKENTSFNWQTFFILYSIVFLIFFFLRDMPAIYDTMIGYEALKRIILSIVIINTSALMISIPIFTLGAIIIRNYVRGRQKNKRIPVFIGLCFLTVSVSVLIFLGLSRTRYSEQQYISDKSDLLGDEHIMLCCISDMIYDEYYEYTVNQLWFDKSRHISSTGRGGSSYHWEYTVSGHYSVGHTGRGQLFEAQIGKADYNRLRTEMPIGYDIKVTVYKNSGFIRSVESTVDFGKSESYSRLYELSVCSGDILRTEKTGEIEIKNLQWCGFEIGQSSDISNSLFGINAENSNIFPYSAALEYDEICLFAVADGKYRRVSNIIYKEDINNEKIHNQLQ